MNKATSGKVKKNNEENYFYLSNVKLQNTFKNNYKLKLSIINTINPPPST